MAIPSRHHERNAPSGGTFFLTSNTLGRRPIFLAEPLANLFIEVLFGYRDKKRFLLHEFTLMPDHFHILLTPQNAAIEAVTQLIKGGYSYRVKKDLSNPIEIWQRGFSEHPIRGASDYENHRIYVHRNAVKRGLVTTPSEYKYCSASGRYGLDSSAFSAAG